MDFNFTPEQRLLRQKCLELAADFAARSAAHDREASHPIENYQRLRDEGFLALRVGRGRGGGGASFLDHTIAYEALGQGCPSTALAFNMHASVIMPLLESPEVTAETKQRLADLVVRERTAGAGQFKAVAYFDALDRLNAHQGSGEPRIEAAVALHVASQSGRQTIGEYLDDAAQRARTIEITVLDSFPGANR